MGHGKTTAVLQRPVQNRMVGGVSQSESQHRRTGGDMRDLWDTAARETERPKNIAVGFVTCWRWTRHMWKGPASGAAGRSPPPLGWSGPIAAGNARQQAGTLCGDFTKASHRIGAADTQLWLEKLTQAARANKSGVRGKRVRLVCGTTSMYTGLDGLTAIIRYHLRCDPYDGSVYVFRDRTGSMLKYIEWDGQSFQQGKRRAQSGTYPWPKGRVWPCGRDQRERVYISSESIYCAVQVP